LFSLTSKRLRGHASTLTDRACSSAGSRYIYDMYYEKEAITKQLYDWLLKNGYADATLIAKWKKQGYEKVCPPHGRAQNDEMLTATPSCAAFGAFRLRRPTSTALASAVCHASS